MNGVNNMTNAEYEAACLAAAMGEADTLFAVNHKMRQYDEAIKQAEATLARLQEGRREFINRFNLNKVAS